MLSIIMSGMADTTLLASTQRLVINLSAPSPQPDQDVNAQLIHVSDIGAGFYLAYEQLRNIAEYREHHLLLRGAIGRYLSRYVRLESPEPFAQDLVVELTQAGYLANDSISRETANQIDNITTQASQLLFAMRACADELEATGWVRQFVAMSIEATLAPDTKTAAIMQFAYEHYLTSVDKSSLAPQAPETIYRVALTCAIQRVIFKSDTATTRYYLLKAAFGEPDPQQAQAIVDLCRLVDDYYQHPLTNKLASFINRYGAPMRIVHKLVMETTNAPALLANRQSTLAKVKLVCTEAYAHNQKQISTRIIRSILFILITKTLIGVSIEIPYDMAVYGHILWQPLVINILFPPLYMALLSLSITAPGNRNTEVISGYIDRLFYVGPIEPLTYTLRKRRFSPELSASFNTVYAFGFMGSLALMVWALYQLGFNVVNGGIFFFFFSAVSFLAWRIRRTSAELQILDRNQGLIQALVDFLSAPFIAIGHWISDRYARANLVTLILDLAIELPFKTIIRLARQWLRFLSDKQDEL